jgi:uncharacterized protein YcgI (DUF1989 family)
MSIQHRIAAATAVAALAATGVAAAAEAPVVGEQGTLGVTRAPVTFPGTGLQKGERLPSGARIVFRDVTVEGDQQATLRLRAAKGRTLRALAVREGDDLGIVVPQGRSYVGRRAVQLRAFAAPDAEGEVASRVYALTR